MSMDRPLDTRVEAPATKLYELGERAGDLLNARGAFVAPVEGILSPHAPRLDGRVLTSPGAQDTSWSANFGSAHLRRVSSNTEDCDVDELVFMPRRARDPGRSGFVVAGWHSLTATPTAPMRQSMGMMRGAIEHLLYAINDTQDSLG